MASTAYGAEAPGKQGRILLLREALPRCYAAPVPDYAGQHTHWFFRRRLAFAQPRRKNARICWSPRLSCRAAARQNRRMLPTRPGGRPEVSHPAAQQIRAFGLETL